MHHEQKTKVIDYLGCLGIGRNEAEVYLYLNAHGKDTVLGISRGLNTGRTKLYPVLENLASKQLITIHNLHYGTHYESVSLDVLEFLVAEQESRTEQLRSSLPTIRNLIENTRADSPAGTRVVEYRGVDGLKQINYNMFSKANGEYCIFELNHLDKHPGMPKSFVEKLFQKQVDRSLKDRDLTNNISWTLDTNVPGYPPLSQTRYVDPAVFKINFETYIYNNCVALLRYSSDDIFGIEIYSQDLANQQQQLFDLLWASAQPITTPSTSSHPQ